MGKFDESDVIQRFLRYVQIDTQSDEESGTSPSTEKQKKLGELLTKELQEMGVEASFDSEHCYVYAHLPAQAPTEEPAHLLAQAPTEEPAHLPAQAPTEEPAHLPANGPADESDPLSGKVLALIAHMDTSPESSGTNVKPRIVEDYDGGDIFLGEESGLTLSPARYPELSSYIGQSLIVTDGTTLLGADDKAGVAEIMSTVRYLTRHPEYPHRALAICFTPDEEIGEGVDHIDLDRLGADYAYTVDGGGIGELEYENFNAASLEVTVRGVTVHPGEAKNKMKHAARIAMEFDALLPAWEKPQYTENYEGFFYLTQMSGSTEEARFSYIIRDHDREKFEAKKELARSAARFLNEKYGEGTVEVALKDSYYNMREKIEPENLFLVERAKKAMEELGITPKIQPIRGGTDGARLSFMGLPCPNLCTGGHNYHGRFEYVCAESMEKITEFLLKLV